MTTHQASIREAASTLVRLLAMAPLLEHETHLALQELRDQLPDESGPSVRCTACGDLAGAVLTPESSSFTPVGRVASIQWIGRCRACARFDTDDAAALHLAQTLGFVIGWVARPNADAIAPYVAMSPAEARHARGEVVWRWGVDDHAATDISVIADAIGGFLNEDLLHTRGLDFLITPEGDRLDVSVGVVRIGTRVFAIGMSEVALVDKLDNRFAWVESIRCQEDGMQGAVYVGPYIDHGADDRPPEQPRVGSIVQIVGTPTGSMRDDEGGLALVIGVTVDDGDPENGPGEPQAILARLDRATRSRPCTRGFLTPLTGPQIAREFDLEAR